MWAMFGGNNGLRLTRAEGGTEETRVQTQMKPARDDKVHGIVLVAFAAHVLAHGNDTGMKSPGQLGGQVRIHVNAGN